MLLASAPRATRARWLGASTLALALATAAPSAVHAQDGTVYIGGGSNSQDGARGVQGGDNVIVNMDAIDGGRGRAGSRTRSGGGGMPADQPNVDFGEPYRGPAGAVLRFPPERPPQSQLVVDPNEIPDRRQASRDAQPADPTPARKPEQRQAQRPEPDPQQQNRQEPAPQRTATATPAAKPDVPDQSQTRAESGPDDLPEAPNFDAGGTAAEESRTAARTQLEPGTSEADSAAEPTELTVRPTRKPQPPEPTRTAERAQTEPRETAAATPDETDTAERDTADAREPAQASEAAGETASDATARQPEPAPEPAPEPTSEPAPEPEPQPTQTAETTTAPEAPAADDTGAADGTQDMAAADTQDAGTQQQAAAGSEPASDPAGDAPETDSATPEATGDDASGDDGAGETQTAALPPEALPDQLRLMFDDGSAGLSDGAESQLDQLARILEENPQQRVQLMAFAEGTEDTASQARRLSLSRALAVRTYLIDRGIRSTRMDVRALGATADEGPLDRVDIVPANR